MTRFEKVQVLPRKKAVMNHKSLDEYKIYKEPELPSTTTRQDMGILLFELTVCWSNQNIYEQNSVYKCKDGMKTISSGVKQKIKEII